MKKLFTKATACLLAVLMFACVFTVAPVSTATAAVQNGASLGVDVSEIKIGSEVRIKSGVTTDYYGKSIGLVYLALTYSVTAISGDKVTIFADYQVGAIGQKITLDVKAVDLSLVVDVEDSDYEDSDNYNNDPRITVGSTVTINPGAKKYGTDEEFKGILRLFEWKVDRISNGVADISCTVSLGMLQNLGISKESFASVFNFDSNNIWYSVIWGILVNTGYTFNFQVAVEDLTLKGGSTLSRTGLYTLNTDIALKGEYWDADKQKMVSANVTLPAGKEIFVMISDSGNDVYAYLENTSGEYYHFKDIKLDSCTFVSKEPVLFGNSGIDTDSYVQLSDNYDEDEFTNFTAIDGDIFAETELENGYSRSDLETELVYNLVYKVTALLGDAVQIELVDEWKHDDENRYIGDELAKIIIAPEYVIPAAGTYRVTTKADIYELKGSNSKGEEIGSLSKNTILYIGDSDMESTHLTGGAVAVRCNEMEGYVDFDKVEYVSEKITYYGDIREGDTVYIKKNVDENYTGKSDLFEGTTARTYFGSDYKTEVYKIPYTVEFTANDYLVLVETKQSRINNGRRYVPDSNLYRIMLNISDVAETANVTDEFLYGDADQDGEVSMSDVTKIQKYVASLSSLSTSQKKAADVDGNGKVNLSDVTTIQKYIAKLIREFPVED